jgi:hypothetical protein
MLPDAITEIYYYLTNKPYFMVYVISNSRRVKKFIQLASSKQKGEDFFLINQSLKCSWWKPETPILDGLKFVTFVDLNNAIPLRIEKEIVYTDDEWLIKEQKKITISEDIEKQKVNKKSGKSLNLIEISFPPTLLFQKVEAHFVKETLSTPPSKWEELKWVFIVAFIVLGFLGWQLINSRSIVGMG